MASFTIEPTEDVVYGFFDRDNPPVLTISPGDTVRLRTLDALWGLEPFPRDRPPFDEQGVQSRRTAPSRHEGSNGHALCGPVFVRGAKPGAHLALCGSMPCVQGSTASPSPTTLTRAGASCTGTLTPTRGTPWISGAAE